MPTDDDTNNESTESHAELDRRILRSSLWVALGYGGKQLLQFCSMLVLVRLLEPSAFGLMALVWVVLFVFDALQESGLGSAFIYRRDDIKHAAGTAAVFAAISGTALYACCFLAAPVAAHLFRAPELTDVLRVSALTLILKGVSVVPSAILERELDFRARANIDLIAATVQVGVSIGLATSGAGVWSLVAGILTSAAITALMYWWLTPWRPSLGLASWGMLRELLHYGRFITAGNLLVLVNNTVDNVLVGRMLGTTQLGFYAVTFRLATMPDDVIGYIVGRVMFPVYSRLQDDSATFRRVYLQNLQRIALLALPASIGLIVAAEPIVLALLGSGWTEVVTPLRILGAYALIRVFAAPSGDVFRGAGRPHLIPAFLLPGTLLTVALLLVLVPRLDLNGAALSMLIVTCSIGTPMFITTMRLLGVRFGELARALAPSFACAGILAVVLVALLPLADTLPPVAALVLMVGVGAVSYIGSTVVLARDVVAPWWASLRGVQVS